MASLLYHALWITTALALIAAASLAFARWLRVRELRRDQAERALDALARYSEWLATQRRTAGFQGDRPALLREVREAQQAAFPELAPALVALLESHARFLDFLWGQQALRLRDPEAWLDSDHDGRFMAMWRDHRVAVHGLADRLRQRVRDPIVDAEPESVFPA